MSSLISISRIPRDKYVNEIVHYLVCRKCAGAKKRTDTMVEKSTIQLGLTPWGLQAWCTVHEINIASFDFSDRRIPAVFNANCRATPDAVMEAA